MSVVKRDISNIRARRRNKGSGPLVSRGGVAKSLNNVTLIISRHTFP